MNQALPVLLLSALLAGGVPAIGYAQGPTAAEPDNIGVNTRDRNSRAMTADQQSNAKKGIELTRNIRRALMDDHSVSTAAHNVKIISANGKVILRGPVKSEREKSVIAEKAEAIAGRNNVRNQLEVESQ